MPAKLPSLRFTRKNFVRSTMLMGACLPMMWSGPVLAQQAVERRVDRLEQEMRAVQRKVFPGGSGQILAPEVAPPVAAPSATIGTPAMAPIADLTARVSAVESQLARMTGQIEENDHRLRQLEASVKQMVADRAAQAAEPASPFSAPSVPAAGSTSQAVTPPRPATGTAAVQARTEAVARVERPTTGNAALDSYTYGYRLWEAKFYPEAQAQLQATIDRYGSDTVASRAHNLLGRAYLDDSKFAIAAKVFYENYRLRPKGERAAESLAWVGESLIQLNHLKDACLAYDELADVFSTNMPAAVREMMAKGRPRAKCGG